MATLFERVFKGSDEMYALAEQAIAEAEKNYGDDEPVAFPNTAYFMGCLYAMTGTKITTFGQLKESMNWIRSQMTREKRTHDIFTSGIFAKYASI